MFFSPPMIDVSRTKPPFWKQVIIGIITVYPLIYMSSILLKPLVSNFSQPIALFLSICTVSPLMIVALPRGSKLFKLWLYR